MVLPAVVTRMIVPCDAPFNCSNAVGQIEIAGSNSGNDENGQLVRKQNDSGQL
jgi:hypothetical protein